MVVIDWLYAVGGVLLLVFAVRLFRRRPNPFPYERVEVLFSPAERSFLGVLDRAAGPDFRVFGKVRVADLIDVADGLDGSSRLRALNRITSKHIDFVICRRADLSVVALVELNDKSHLRRDRAARDEFIRNVAETVGLPLLEVTARSRYSLAELREQLRELLADEFSVDESGGRGNFS